MPAFGEAEEDGVGANGPPRVQKDEGAARCELFAPAAGRSGTGITPGHIPPLGETKHKGGIMTLLPIGADDAALQEMQDISFEASA